MFEAIAFALRNVLRAELRPYQEQYEDKTFDWTEQQCATAACLTTRYDLRNVMSRCSRERYLEILTYLLWLDTLWGTDAIVHHMGIQPLVLPQSASFSIDSPNLDVTSRSLHWLDVGAKNWAYVDALAAFIRQQHAQTHFTNLTDKTQSPEHLPFQLDGVELDPHRRYTSLHTRGQTAKAFAAAIPQAQYHEGDIRHWRKKTHVITHFLPFVVKDPHVAWGLPVGLFAPLGVLMHLLGLLEPRGVLIIVNQGEAEAEAQEALLKQARQRLDLAQNGLDYACIGILPSPFIAYRYPRYGWRVSLSESLPLA